MPRCVPQTEGRKYFLPVAKEPQMVPARLKCSLIATSPQHNFFVMTVHAYAGTLGIVMNGLVHANAFVVQFRSAAGASEEQFSGRVEHVASGRTATFHSMEELPKLLLKMLQDFRAGEWATSD